MEYNSNNIESEDEVILHRLVCYRCGLAFIGEVEQKKCKRCGRDMEKSGTPCKVVVIKGQWQQIQLKNW